MVPLAKGAQQGSAVAVITAGAAAAQHHAGTRPLAVAAIVAVTAAAVIGIWLFWHWRQRHQQEA